MGLASLSLFSTRRLFDLRLPSGRPDADGSKAIPEYCENPPPDTVLMITAQEWSRSTPASGARRSRALGHVVPVWPVRPTNCGDWLEQRLRSRGLSAEPAAVQLARRARGRQPAGRRAGSGEARAAGAGQPTRRRGDGKAGRRFRALRRVQAGGGRVGRRSAALRAHAPRRLRGEGEQVPGLLPILAMELLKVASLARIAGAGGNLAERHARSAHLGKQAGAVPARAGKPSRRALGRLRRRGRTDRPDGQGPARRRSLAGARAPAGRDRQPKARNLLAG